MTRIISQPMPTKHYYEQRNKIHIQSEYCWRTITLLEIDDILIALYKDQLKYEDTVSGTKLRNIASDTLLITRIET